MPRIGVPADVALIRQALAEALNSPAENGRKIGDAIFGVYAFFDYDGEPIYAGQTKERLRVRIRRHLTNHRTDAVAMNVLDPFEVFAIEMWPLWDLEGADKSMAKDQLNAVEYTVYQKIMEASSYKKVLNEKNIVRTPLVDLPKAYRFQIVPASLVEPRKHPDVRIARRASTIASLAKVISERDVSPGLRRTLLTQAQRLENLASLRFGEFASDPIEEDGEE